MDIRRSSDSDELSEELLKRRIISVEGHISSDMMRIIRLRILMLSARSDDCIKLLINSEGGEIVPTGFVFDAIRLSAARVIGIVNGSCDSAAITLLQACHRRLATRHSSFYLHFVRHDAVFPFKSSMPSPRIERMLEIRIREIRRIQKETEKILSERSGLARSKIRRYMADGEEYGTRLDPEEAKAIGLIDEVIDDFDLFQEVQTL